MSITGQIHANNYKELRHLYANWAPDTNDSWVQDVVARCIEPTGARGPGELTGTHYFASTFFPKSVKKMFTEERIQYLSLLDDDTIPNLFALTHRGFGKTTLAIFALTRALLCRNQKYILFTSGIYDVAAKRTEAIRAALSSPEVVEIFGNMRPVRGEHIGAQFSEEAFVLIDPDTNEPMACVQPRGSEQVVNGSLVMLGGEMQRPTMVFSDDGQKRLHIGNNDLRDRYIDWWESEVEPLPEADSEPDAVTHRWKKPASGAWIAPYRFIVTDTCKHVDAHIMRLVTNPRWTGVVFPLGEEVDGKLKLKHKIMSAGAFNERIDKFRYKMDVFYREFMCAPSSNESRAWNSEMFKHYKEGTEDFSNAFKFIVIDPARSVGVASAYTSILVVAVKPDKGIFLRKNIVARLEPDAYYKETFGLARDYMTRLVIPEETGLAMVIKNAFHQAASIAGLGGQIEFDWIQSKRHPGVEYGTGQDAIKKARCSAMLPYYQQGMVYHEESLRGGPLERAQLQFPDCTFWDATDTAGYIPEIMERYEVYLDAKPGSEMVIEDEYATDYDEAGEYFRSKAWCN
jgi:hypothetical protein